MAAEQHELVRFRPALARAKIARQAGQLPPALIDRRRQQDAHRPALHRLLDPRALTRDDGDRAIIRTEGGKRLDETTNTIRDDRN